MTKAYEQERYAYKDLPPFTSSACSIQLTKYFFALRISISTGVLPLA
jgi:hypothetical protein